MKELVDQVAAGRSLWVELECSLYSIAIASPVIPTSDPLHCTVIFLGRGRTPAYVDLLLDQLTRVADQTLPLTSRVSGLARFRGSERDGDPVVLLLSDAHIRTLHRNLQLRLAEGLGDWDYTPHVTLGRVPRDVALPLYALPLDCAPVTFSSIAACAGEARVSLPL